MVSRAYKVLNEIHKLIIKIIVKSAILEYDKTEIMFSILISSQNVQNLKDLTLKMTLWMPKMLKSLIMCVIMRILNQVDSNKP